MYVIRYYKGKSGRSPINDFIDTARESLRTKIARQFLYLEEFGLSSSNQALKKLTGTPLWEVRILGKDSTRIICVAIVKREIVIIHIFRKKSNKMSSKDLNISLKRYKEELDR